MAHDCDQDERKCDQKNGTRDISATGTEKFFRALDRAATNVKFNRLLHSYRQVILPVVHSNWEELGEEQREAMSRINNHFCGLHMLVNLAEQCNAVLAEWEKATLGTSSQGAAALPGISPRGSESGTLCLVRTACKALQKHGSEQSGRPEDFAAFCASKNIEIPLATFRGNRFNILFINSAGVYFLSSTMKEFLSFHATNRLLQAVAADLKVDAYLVGCRALGLIEKLVTAPLWRYLVQSSSSFTDVVVVYRQLARSLACYAEDAAPLVDGSARAFTGASVDTTSTVLDSLLTPTSSDSSLKELLQLLCTCFHTYMQRAWSCYLASDTSVSTPDDHETASLPKVNVISERDFAQLDRFMREKPRATTLAVESFIMLGNNKTVAWLAAKTPDERGAILQAARSLVPRHRSLPGREKLPFSSTRRTS